jgi:imidazolonepropionase-like amidohydrolase
VFEVEPRTWNVEHHDRYHSLVSNTRVVSAAVAVVALLTAGVDTQQKPAPGAPLALVGGTLIDGTASAPVRNSVILVRGQRIEKVGTVGSLPVPEGYAVVSTEGMTVLPGLWDPHVHLLYGGHPDFGAWFTQHARDFERITIPASAEALLLSGVTSVRDLGAPLDAVMAVKKRIASGELPGPTVYVAGPVLMNGAPSYFTHTISVTTDADARAKVRQLITAGVDVIKMANMDQMPPAAPPAIVAESHARGIKVTAHGRTEAEIRIGLASGLDEFQHIGTDSPEYPPDIVAGIRQRLKTGPPLTWSLTVGTQLNAADMAADPEFLDDPRNFRGLPTTIVNEVRQAAAKALETAKPPSPDTARIVKRKVAQLQELGVEFVFGSDVGGFGAPAGAATWRELDAWVRELGIEPAAAIRKATSEAARAMGDRQSGTIAIGMNADIIAVRGNPLRHIDVLRDPAIVIRHGEQVK